MEGFIIFKEKIKKSTAFLLAIIMMLGCVPFSSFNPTIAEAATQEKAADNLTKVAAGMYHAVFLKDGILYGMGSNSLGQLTGEDTTNKAKPYEMDISEVEGKIIDVKATTFATIIKTNNNKVYYTGRLGNIGSPTQNSQFTEIKIEDGKTVKEIGTGRGDTAYIVYTDGSVYAMGKNDKGQLGVGTQTNPITTMTKVNLGSPYKEFRLNDYNGVYLDDTNNLYGVGKKDTMGLGPSTSITTSFQKLKGIPSGKAVKLELASNTVLVLSDKGEIFSTGGSYNLGNSSYTSTTSEWVTVVNPDGAKWTDIIENGDSATFAFGDNGKVYAWGSNSSGILGVNYSASNSVREPKEVYYEDVNKPGNPGKSFDIPLQIASANDVSIAVMSDGSIYTWGDGRSCGQNTTARIKYPRILMMADFTLSSNNDDKPKYVNSDNEAPITITGTTKGITGTVINQEGYWIRVNTDDSLNYAQDGNFETYLAANQGIDAGTVTLTGTDEEKQFTFAVGENGTYWFKTKLANGEALYKKIVIDNIYTKTPIYIKGTMSSDRTKLVYDVREVVEGEVKLYGALTDKYGVAYDVDGTVLTSAANTQVFDPAKWETLNLTIVAPEVGGYTHYRGVATQDVKLDQQFALGRTFGSTEENPIEFVYDKDATKWADVTYVGVDESRNPLPAGTFVLDPDTENLPINQSYTRKPPIVAEYTAIGYYTSLNSTFVPFESDKATFELTQNMTIYVVYREDAIGVSGKVTIKGTEGSTEAPNGIALPGVTLIFTKDDGSASYTIVTDANGDYEAIEVGDVADLIGTYTVTTSPSPIDDGFKPFIGSINVDGVELYDIQIELEENIGVSYITVVDESGVIQPNATVVVDGRTYITGDNGKTVAIDLELPGPYVAFVTKAGFIPANKYITFDDGKLYKNITVTLKKNTEGNDTGSIWGYVTDKADGTPVANVTVTVLGGKSATTDENGFYVIHDVTPGTHTLIAQKAGYDSGTGTVVVKKFEFTQKDLEISKSGENGAKEQLMLRGQVTDEKTGLPITGAKVEYDGKSTTTDEFGYYVLGYFEKDTTIEPKATANNYLSSSKTVENISADTTVNFSLKKVVTMTVVGKLPGEYGKELYRYTTTKEYSDITPVDITSYYVPTYRVKNQTTPVGQIPAYRTESVMPDKNKTVVFEYESNLTNVEILVYDKNTNEQIEGTLPLNFPAEVGYPFSFQNSLTIPGYDYLYTNNNGQIANVEQTGSSIILYYEKQVNPTKGQFYITAQDNKTNEIIGVKVNNDLVNKGETFVATDGKALTSVDIEILRYYDLIPNSATPKSTTYNGYDSPENITYKYERKTNGYVVELWDYVTKTKIPEEGFEIYDEPTGKLYTVHRPTAPTGYEAMEGTIEVANFILEPGENHVIKFWYMPTEEETINIKTVWNNKGIEEEILGYSQQLIGLTGETATLTAPNIPGYTLTSADKVTATFGTDGEVKFVYKKEMVTVTIKFLDEQGKEIAETRVEQYQKDVQQFIVSDIIANYQAQAPIAYSMAFTKDTTIEFIYKKLGDVIDENIVNVLIEGKNKDTGDILYSYTITQPKSDNTFEAEAFDLNKYVLVNPDEKVATIKADGSELKHTFEYTSLETTVTVIATDEYGKIIPGTETIERTVVKRENYVVFAPHIPGYNLVGEMSQELRPVEGGETVVFVYKEATGNIVVNLVDSEEGNVIKTVSANVTLSDGEKEIAIPDLTSENWIVKEGQTPTKVTYSDKTQYVAYEYEKVKRSVAVYTSIDGGEKVLASTPEEYKVGTVQYIEAPNLADAKLIGSDVQAVYVEKGTGNQEVVFNYTTLKDGEVVVKAVCDGNIIQTYTLKTTLGGKVTANAPSILGYKLKTGENPEKTGTAPGEIVFEYVKDEVTLKVYYKDYDSKTSIKTAVTYTVKKGDTITVYAPHLNDYVLVGADSKTFKNLQEAASHTFEYKSLGKVINENTVDVLIKGIDKDTNKELYSYTVTQPISDETFTVEAFDLEKYELVDESKKTATISADGSVTEHTFEYTSLKTSVTIIAQLKDDPSKNLTVERPAVIGEPYVAQAPFIRGYNLVSRSRLSVPSVEGDEELVFEYEVAEGNVTVMLIDSETNAVIKTVNENITVGDGNKVIPIPDLTEDNYSVKQGQATQKLRYSASQQTVEYYYVRDKQTVDVYTLYNGVETRVSSVEYPIDSVQTILAPEAPTGSKLAEPNSKTILVKAGTQPQKVVFEYTTIEDGEVVVNAVYDGQIIQSFTISATTGSTVTATAPTILGYKLKGTDDEKSTTAPGTIVFEYEKDEVTITVHYKSEGDNITSADKYKVARGGDITVYAPYFKGYALSGINSRTFKAVMKDDEAVFNYNVVDTESTDLIVKFIDVDNNDELGQELIKGVTVGETYSYEYPSLETAAYNFNYSNPVNSGKTIDIRLAENNNEILVYYSKKTADVTVNHYDNTSGALLDKETITGQKIGTLYTADYYDTDNYYYLKGESQTLVKDGTNVMNIYYIKKSDVPAGSVVIQHVDKETGVILKTEIKTDLTSTRNDIVSTYLIDETYSIDEANLGIEITSGSAVKMTKDKMTQRPSTVEKALATQYSYNTAVEQEVINIKNTGYDIVGGDTVYTIPVGESITIKYVSNVSKTQKVTVEYFDVTNNEIIQTVQTTGILNTLYVPYIKYFENYKFSSIEPSGGVLVTTGVNKVRVNYSEIEDLDSIKIPAILKIIYNYNGEEIYSTTLHGFVGDTIDYIAEVTLSKDGHNYKVVNEADIFKSIVLQDGVNVLEFNYEEIVNNNGGNSGGGGGGGGSVTPVVPVPVVPVVPVVPEVIPTPVPEPIIVDDTDILGLDTINHIKYIYGYTDGTFKPENGLTRGEAASILYNLSTKIDKTRNYSNPFSDVSEDLWCYNQIGALSEIGVLSGYPDGTFRPNDQITRSEFVTILVRAKNIVEPYEPIYTDVTEAHWARGYITAASKNGWISGYENKEFRPDNNISRSEAVTIVNNVLNRKITKDEAKKVQNPYSDIDATHWAYQNIIEASIAHEYERLENGYEQWKIN